MRIRFFLGRGCEKKPPGGESKSVGPSGLPHGHGLFRCLPVFEEATHEDPPCRFL